MSIGMRILTTLLALLALPGVAAAQNAPCPECDSDGEPNPDNWYGSVDVGAVGDRHEALADADAAAQTGEQGFFAWLGVCLGAFVQHVEDLLGLRTDVDASAEAYASDDGVDLDATVVGVGDGFDLDESRLGDLDGMTWDAMAEAKAATGADPALPEKPGLRHADVDACLHEEVALAACG